MKIEIDEKVYNELAKKVMESNKSLSAILVELLETSKIKGSEPNGSSETIGEKLRKFILSPEYKLARTAKEQYLHILSWLSTNREQDFYKIENFRSGKRTYFDKDPKKIIGSGKSMSADPIPNSEYFVFCGIENRSKRKNLVKILQNIFGYSAELSRQVAETICDSDKGNSAELDLNEYK